MLVAADPPGEKWSNVHTTKKTTHIKGPGNSSSFSSRLILLLSQRGRAKAPSSSSPLFSNKKKAMPNICFPFPCLMAVQLFNSSAGTNNTRQLRQEQQQHCPRAVGNNRFCSRKAKGGTRPHPIPATNICFPSYYKSGVKILQRGKWLSHLRPHFALFLFSGGAAAAAGDPREI